MIHRDEYVLFSEVWDSDSYRWVTNSAPSSSNWQQFKISLFESPRSFEIIYTIDGQEIPREDYLAVLASVTAAAVKR